jgi:2'-5' RNA ligase
MDELAAVSKQLRSDGDRLRWPAPASWHITLQFLGNAAREQYECTVARLRALRFKAVPTRLVGLGFFDRSGILFANVEVTPELSMLEQQVTGAAKQCGFALESRPYQPHITLARRKDKAERQGLVELKTRISQPREFTRFVAEEFLLYESFLGPAGSRYEVRERFRAGGL